MRPRNSRGNVSKVGTATGEGGAMGGSQRNSLTEVQMLLPKQNMSDLTLLIRDKQIQNGIPSTPLGKLNLIMADYGKMDDIDLLHGLQ